MQFPLCPFIKLFAVLIEDTILVPGKVEVGESERCIDFDAVIVLAGRTANKQETNCIFCLKKATARFIHWYQAMCCFGKLAPFTWPVAKTSSKYYSGLEVKMLWPCESLSLASFVCY